MGVFVCVHVCVCSPSRTQSFLKTWIHFFPSPHEFVITSDFSILLDNPTDHFTSQFCLFFQPHSARQLSYHGKNHILDLAITSADTSLAPAVSPTHWSSSDHFRVFTKLSINPAPLSPPTLYSFQQFHSIDIGSFLTDLKFSQLIIDPPKSLGPLLIAYNTTLSSLLDKHAPKLSRLQSLSHPYFTLTLHTFWSTLLHAENLWKRTHSAVDLPFFNSLEPVP